jgi:hypothetical protein
VGVAVGVAAIFAVQTTVKVVLAVVAGASGLVLFILDYRKERGRQHWLDVLTQTGLTHKYRRRGYVTVYKVEQADGRRVLRIVMGNLPPSGEVREVKCEVASRDSVATAYFRRRFIPFITLGGGRRYASFEYPKDFAPPAVGVVDGEYTVTWTGAGGAAGDGGPLVVPERLKVEGLDVEDAL